MKASLWRMLLDAYSSVPGFPDGNDVALPRYEVSVGEREAQR